MNAALRTRFSKLVDARTPIVRTGMGWVAGARLAACHSGRHRERRGPVPPKLRRSAWSRFGDGLCSPTELGAGLVPRRIISPSRVLPYDS
jgi:hypothetical protein